VGAAESPQEYGVVPKACLLRCLQHRHPLTDLLRRLLGSLLADILVDSAAVDLLETVHQVVAADEKGSRQALNGQLFTEVVTDKMGNLLHFRIESVGYRCLFRRGLPQIPVEGHHQLQSAGVGQEGSGKLLALSGLFQPAKQVPVAVSFLASGTIEVKFPLAGKGEAGGEIR